MSRIPIGPLSSLAPRRVTPHDEVDPEDQALFLRHIVEYCTKKGTGITVVELAEYDDVPLEVATAAMHVLARRGFVRWYGGAFCVTPAGERHLQEWQSSLSAQKSDRSTR